MQPGAYDDTYTHVTRERPSWTTRPGWRASRAQRTAPPSRGTPSDWARRTRPRLVPSVVAEDRGDPAQTLEYSPACDHLVLEALQHRYPLVAPARHIAQLTGLPHP
jgi:hypothetical protein